MEEYKSNSYKSREEPKKEREKKFDSVISGSAKVQKKSVIQKIADSLIYDDIDSVEYYILSDVLVPSVKKAILDIVTNGIDVILYGETGRSRKNSTNASKISYNSIYNQSEQEHRNTTQSAYRTFDYDNLLFNTRQEAEEVLDAMNEAIESYGVVSVGDLYDLAGVSTDNFTVNNYGWENIAGCRAVRVRDGYILNLPKAVPI